MKIYLKAKIVLLAVAMLFAVSQCQTADDDEVEISVPGYPYKFYSGIINPTQAIFYWELLRLKSITMYSFLLKTISLTILYSFGLLELLDVQPYYHVFTKMDHLSLSQQKKPLQLINNHGIKRQVFYTWRFQEVQDILFHNLIKQ